MGIGNTQFLIVSLYAGITIVMLSVCVIAYLKAPAEKRNPNRKPLPRKTQLLISLFTVGLGVVRLTDHNNNIYAAISGALLIAVGAYALYKLKKTLQKHSRFSLIVVQEALERLHLPASN